MAENVICDVWNYNSHTKYILTSNTFLLPNSRKNNNTSMRKIVFTLVLLATTVSAYSQLIHWSAIQNKANSITQKGDANGDGEVDISDVVFVVNEILSGDSYQESCDVNGDGNVDISDVVELVNIILNGNQTSLCPDDNHPHMIDLGLPSGTKWACCNVDTSHPENQSPTNGGGYYSWGELEEKSTYTWDSYIYARYTGGAPDYTFINIGSNICGTEYDVAQMKWGGSWRMPSLEDFEELVNNCTWTGLKDKKYNNIYGLLLTGPNGNKIFLPAAGSAGTLEVYDYDNCCYYWTGTHVPWSENDYPYSGFCVNSFFFSDGVLNIGYDFWENAMLGCSVRPVAK